jgi:hypothetical protein
MIKTTENKYLLLPTKKNPKVALNIRNRKAAINAFKLYNPFSIKAKLLKYFFFFLTYLSPFYVKKIFSKVIDDKNALIRHMVNELQEDVIPSFYYATNKDKVVLQLQTLEGDIVGYLKYPINEIGLLHIENEEKAIQILSDKKIVHNYLLQGEFHGTPFILLSPLEGHIGLIERQSLEQLVLKFRKDGLFLLGKHPRIKTLEQNLKSVNLTEYVQILASTIQESTTQYACVYEHGDFAPWNIVNAGGQLIPFDFEFFVNEGLEHLDMIKYYFQVGTLLQNKSGKELISFVHFNIHIDEFFCLFKIFLIKEIYNKTIHNEGYEFELDLLSILEL